MQHNHISLINNLAVKSKSLALQSQILGLVKEAKQFNNINQKLSWFLLQYKMFGGSTHYIWRTQDDSRVRPAHAANDDKIFAWNNRPETGHPGEDYGCRCWAEPVGASEYANQVLITTINDNPDKWKWYDFVFHYINGSGKNLTLEETGLMADIEEYFAESAIASDGLQGVYRAVNRQIIDAAKAQGEGPVDYNFNSTYEFGEVVFVFGGSKVKGVFDGDARREGDFLAINGIMSYEFEDDFTDPFDITERLRDISGLDRVTIELLLFIAEYFSDFDRDFAGTSFLTIGQWKTKFNATVKFNPEEKVTLL